MIDADRIVRPVRQNGSPIEGLLKIVHGTHCICAIGWIVQEEQEQHFIATLANERPMCSMLISKSNEFKSFACIEKFESGSSHFAHPPVALPPAGLACASP